MFTILDDTIMQINQPVHRGRTAFLVISLTVLFASVALGIVVLIAKRRRTNQNSQEEDLEYHRLMTK